MENNPDSWVLLKIGKGKKAFFKVLAGWSGSYLYGSSWRLNSGICKLTETDTHYQFHGESGSVYNCHKGAERVTSALGGTLSRLLELPEVKRATIKQLKRYLKKHPPVA